MENKMAVSHFTDNKFCISRYEKKSISFSYCGLRISCYHLLSKKKSSKQLYLAESRDLPILFPPCWLSQTLSQGCRGHVSKALSRERRFSNAMCTQRFYYNFSRKIKNNTKENHSSRWIKHPILVSQIIIIKNHGSRRLPKSRFTRNREVISQFTGNKTSNSRFTKILFTTLFI